MKILFRFICVALAIFFSSTLAYAEAIDLSAEMPSAIGQHARFLKEDGAPLSPNEALGAYAAARFQASQSTILNFGLGSEPVWIGLDATNPGHEPIKRRLSVETSWLDSIDIYFVRDGRIVESIRTGDSLPFAQRSIKNRFFVADFTFSPGETTILMRVATPDPMVVPIYLDSIEKTQSRYTLEAYSYGFLYGSLMALLAYNLMLFFSLRNARYLLYSVYLATFTIMNIAYTGHGYAWLWPNSPQWQMWSNLVLMVACAVSGLLFATRFLETKRNFPRLHRGVMGGVLVVSVLSPAAVIAGSHLAMVLIAFVFIILFPPTMVILGTVSVLAGIKSAKYFLLASVTAAAGSFLTALDVSGLIPNSVLTYRAVDIGMFFDAVLLAMALADQFRISQNERAKAEHLANLDPLTEMNNRRSFYDLAASSWNTGQRHKHPMSMIVMDLDRFKLINDTHGHACGDAALIKIAEFIKESARAGDIAARWGGEEFVIFLPEADLDEATSVAERLRVGVGDINFEWRGEKISFTASFGVSELQSRDISLDDLIREADRHLRAAKAGGRNQVCSLQPA